MSGVDGGRIGCEPALGRISIGALLGTLVFACFAASSRGVTRFEGDPTFAPAALSGPVAGNLTPFPLADGSVLVAGPFRSVDGVVAGPWVRLTASGQLVNAQFAAALFSDTAFPSARPLVQFADGSLLFGQTGATGEIGGGRLRRIFSNGAVDAAYALTLAPAAGESVAVHGGWRLADGRVFISGNFGQVGSHATRDVAMLLPDGSVDTRFSSTTDFIGIAAVGSDGRFVGLAERVWPPETVSTGSLPHRIVRLGEAGQEIETWLLDDAGLGAQRALAVDVGNRVLVSVSRGDGWTIPLGVSLSGTATIFRFESGQPAGVVYSASGARIDQLHLLPDGGILLVGIMPRPNAQQPLGLLKLTPGGAVDPSLVASFPVDVRIVGLTRAGAGWIAATRSETAGTIFRSSLAKLDPGFGRVGGFEPDFRAAPRIDAAHALNDATILLEGAFLPPATANAQRFVKLRSTGEFDFAGVPRPADPARTTVIHVGTDGRIYTVAPYPGASAVFVVAPYETFVERYAPDGTRDEAFGQRKLANGAATITAAHVDTAGRVLLSGALIAPTVPFPEGSGSGRGVVQRLLPSGAPDGAFVFQNPTAGPDHIATIAELPGKGYAIAGAGRLAAVAENGALLGKPVARIYDAAVSKLIRTGGHTYALGNFAGLLGVNSGGIVRLDAGGFPDPIWRSGFGVSDSVVAAQSLADGRLLVTRDVYAPDVAPPPSRHIVLDADGAADPNENPPGWETPPLVFASPNIPTPRTMLAAATDGRLYEFAPAGAMRRFRPAPRPAVVPLPSGIVYFDADGPLRLAVQLPDGASGTIQWYRNGELLTGETGTVFSRANSTVREAGLYTAQYVEADGEPVFATFRVRMNRPAARILNVSARSFVGEGSDLQILGFVVDQHSVEPTLHRSIQRDLAAFGVGQPVRKTSLHLYRRGLAVEEPNAPFVAMRSGGALEHIVLRAGGFPVSNLEGNPHALFQLQANEIYTLHISARAADSGVALNELFLPTPIVSDLEERIPQRFMNFSCRGEAGGGERALIAGFVIGGNRTLPVLIRGLGPALHAAGVADATFDPAIELHRDGRLIASNDDWDRQSGANEIALAATRLGAPALGPGAADAALLVELPPGAYTVTLRAKDTGDRVGMIEIFDALP